MECPVQILSSHPIFPSSLLFFPPQICSAAYFHGLKKWEIRVLLVRGDGYSRIWTDGPDWKGQKSLASPIRFGFHPESLCVCFFLTFIFVRSPRVYFWELWCCSVLFSPPPLQLSRLGEKNEAKKLGKCSESCQVRSGNHFYFSPPNFREFDSTRFPPLHCIILLNGQSLVRTPFGRNKTAVKLAQTYLPTWGHESTVEFLPSWEKKLASFQSPPVVATRA